MRKLLGAILRGMAAMVVVPVTMMINGIKTVVQMILPGKNQALMQDADEVIREGNSADALAAMAEAKANGSHRKPTEYDRIRSAASERGYDRHVPVHLLDPSKPAEKQLLEWFAPLDKLQLTHVANATDAELKAHLSGKSAIPVPLLPEMQVFVEERKAAAQPLTKIEWVRELMRRAAENGADPDGDMLDDLLDQAQALADRNATLEDYPATTAPSIERVNDDREDA